MRLCINPSSCIHNLPLSLSLLPQPSQQQKQRTAQNSESVLRAYGVPKLDSLSATNGGGSMVGPSKPYQSIYPPVVQQSSAAAAMATGGSSAGVGAIAFPNPSVS